MAKSNLTVVCTYRVKKTKEAAFVSLLRKHWPTLHRLGLASDEPSACYRGEDRRGRPFYLEIFSWKSQRAVERAHTQPEVMAVWEPMETLCEKRDGLPSMEFPHVARLKLGRGR